MAKNKGFSGKWGVSHVTINAFLKSAGLSTSHGKLEHRIHSALRFYGIPYGGKSAVKAVADNADFIRAKAAPFREQSRHITTRSAPTRVQGVDVTSDAFLSTYEWRRVRMMALKKYGPVCQCCGATPATGAVMNVDHIKPRRLFPQLALDVENLQILCHECNHGKGNWDMTDWREAPLDPESAARLDYLLGT